MSKIKVKVTNPNNGQYRLVELESRAPSLAKVDADSKRKFGVNSSMQFLYRLPSGTHMSVNNDGDLQRACQESSASKKPFVDLELSGPGAHAASQAHQAAHSQQSHQPAYHQPAQPAYHQPAQPAYHQQQSHQPAHDPSQQGNRSQGTNRTTAAAPAASSNASLGANTIVHINYKGIPGGAARMKLNHAQDDDYYIFSPEIASVDTLCEVEIEGSKKLVFKMSSSTARFTQTFNIPFDISPKDVGTRDNSFTLKLPDY